MSEPQEDVLEQRAADIDEVDEKGNDAPFIPDADSAPTEASTYSRDEKDHKGEDYLP
jgi:capsid protein